MAADGVRNDGRAGDNVKRVSNDGNHDDKMKDDEAGDDDDAGVDDAGPPPFPPVHSQGGLYKKGPRAALRTLYRLYLSLVWISGSKTCIFAKAPHHMHAPSVF